jgi:Cellulase (glycosyl hydrolase family 5)
MSFWDGTRWIRESELLPPTTSRPLGRRVARIRDLIATAVIVLGLAATAFPFGPASAGGPSLTLAPQSGTAGQSVQLSGRDFEAKTRLQVTWDGTTSRMPTAQVNGTGSFQVSITLPSGPTGPHTVAVLEVMSKGNKKAAQLGSAIIATVIFSLTAAAATPTPTSATTPTPAPTAAPTAAPKPTAAPTATPEPPPAATATPESTPPPTATPEPTTAPTAPPAATSTPTPAGFVSACGASLCLDGERWYMFGASMVGGLEDPAGTVNRARAAGLNTLRVTNWLHEEAGNDPYDPVRWELVDGILAAAHSGGVKVVLDLSTYRNYLFNSGLDPYTQDWAKMVSFVANRRNTVNGLRYGDDPTIALIGFAGEVEGINGNADTRTPTTAQLTEFFRRTFAEWRALDAKHLLSPGGLLHYGWDSGIDWRAIFSLADNDVCSIHNYSNVDSSATPSIAGYCASIGKPWITEEFGWDQRLGDSTRASEFGAMYALQRANGSAGAAFWNLGQQTSGSTYDVNPATALTYGTVQLNAP